ncbi:ArsB/NhaD family transporter [Brevibacillus antibioticus]|uniref:ArsB/NhaD family transporter n=1 Tax=Brevibacillus antibioticus TaxID=2570228 RepID=A0A4U2Y5V1_9BACL|nr:ArsB/NhaD family transporter [Brevibacillus antibioticus]TKI55867.1 ArsB/NhaD family transporter [Brevibacillus antibioticus]
MTNQALFAIAIFLVTYAFIISEKLHRTIVAMSGGILMVLFGIVTQEQAIHHIDFNTLGLLIGMMILVAITAQTGVFKYVAIRAAKVAKGKPIRILVYLSLITAVASAFLDNVTTVLLIVPVTFSIARQLELNPIPFLISEIIASNAGGTATLIGDPPNIMIGSSVPELDFMKFLVNLSPIIIVILAVTVVCLVLIYRKQLVTSPKLSAKIMQLNERDEITDTRLLKKSLTVMALTILGFMLHGALHLESATIALTGAFLLLLLTGEHYLEDAISKVEWNTIFFFIGLFVLVSGLVETGVIAKLANEAMKLTGGDSMKTSLLILWLSAIASAFVDNIPFVATMIPMIKEMGALGITNLEPLWWSLALGACLGGNGTLIGASANVIVAGLAAKEGHHIGFFSFMKVAFPLMILSILIAHVYVYLRYFIW